MFHFLDFQIFNDKALQIQQFESMFRLFQNFKKAKPYEGHISLANCSDCGHLPPGALWHSQVPTKSPETEAI